MVKMQNSYVGMSTTLTETMDTVDGEWAINCVFGQIYCDGAATKRPVKRTATGMRGVRLSTVSANVGSD
jgi:hypothetical protein